jgi:hypothetical protein
MSKKNKWCRVFMYSLFFIHGRIKHIPLDTRLLIHCFHGYFGILTLDFLLIVSLVEDSY